MIPKDDNANPLFETDGNGTLIQPVDENGVGISVKNPAGENVPTVNKNGKPVLPINPLDGIPLIPFIKNLFNVKKFDLPKNSEGDDIVPVDNNGNNILPRDPGTGKIQPPMDKDGNPLLIFDDLGRMILKTDENGVPINPLGKIFIALKLKFL